MKFTYLAVFVALIATATADWADVPAQLSEFIHDHTFTKAEAKEIAHKH